MVTADYIPIKTAASALKASKRLADSPTQKHKEGRLSAPARSQEEFWGDDGVPEGHGERSRLLGSESPSGRTSLELGEGLHVGQSPWARYLPLALRLLAAGVLVTLLILVYKYLDVEAAVEFFKANPGKTLPLYFVCHVVSIVLFVPGALPQMLAGELDARMGGFTQHARAWPHGAVHLSSASARPACAQHMCM